MYNGYITILHNYVCGGAGTVGGGIARGGALGAQVPPPPIALTHSNRIAELIEFKVQLEPSLHTTFITHVLPQNSVENI